ncbi:helix-turn-helix transcriptional regulator [Mycolicibacterium aubagnense]|uniref:helix-turn-helix transcriptional regulator n=2 Tax=Mycobacteriaceae TaxID=1762 RepID=UPI003CC674C3
MSMMIASSKSVARPRVVRTPAADIGANGPARGWTFLTNHGHVLLCLAHAGSLTARELSLRIGITERSVQAILADLIADGYLHKTKVGRRNDYAVNVSGRLRHPLEADHTVGELIKALT